MSELTPEQLSRRTLNFGSGLERQQDWLTVDIRSHVRPDLVWDLDQLPYPLPEHHYDLILAHDVIEHLRAPLRALEEAHRLLRPDGRIEITTPHFSCSNSFTDPTHLHHLGYYSFDYFTDESPWSFYSEARFEIEHRNIAFHPGRISKFFAAWANRHPALYERRLCWIFPAWFLFFRLRALPARSTVEGA
ncbi:MAG TPA: methyltransferase domain-containing protein [Thermoanaerobaculia bacterium]|nr:methyltransferase domain-containing protein [Thermoanaerobaculia bacterium]